jgi:uncharacterized protein with HEPN domain
MRPDPADLARLWDMLDAARVGIQFTAGRRFEDFLGDRMLRNAVERNLEIIGEAARGVSPGFRDSHPEIPWRSIIALRNVLAHEYGEIRYERLWVVCTEQLAVLVRQLEKIGVEPGPESES